MKFTPKDMVNLAINNDASNLEKAFDSVMQSKIEDALEVRRDEIAQSLGTQEDQ
jgi:hypothetical protein